MSKHRRTKVEVGWTILKWLHRQRRGRDRVGRQAEASRRREESSEDKDSSNRVESLFASVLTGCTQDGDSAAEREDNADNKQTFVVEEGSEAWKR